MKRLKRLEKMGYKVSVFTSGNGAIAVKNNRSITGNSITDLHKKIIG